MSMDLLAGRIEVFFVILCSFPIECSVVFLLGLLAGSAWGRMTRGNRVERR